MVCDNCREPFRVYKTRPTVTRCRDIWTEPHTHPTGYMGSGPEVPCDLLLCWPCVRNLKRNLLVSPGREDVTT